MVFQLYQNRNTCHCPFIQIIINCSCWVEPIDCSIMDNGIAFALLVMFMTVSRVNGNELPPASYEFVGSADCKCGTAFCWKSTPCPPEPCPDHCIPKLHEYGGIPVANEFYNGHLKDKFIGWGVEDWGIPLTEEEQRIADHRAFTITVLNMYAQWISVQSGNLH